MRSSETSIPWCIPSVAKTVSVSVRFFPSRLCTFRTRSTGRNVKGGATSREPLNVPSINSGRFRDKRVLKCLTAFICICVSEACAACLGTILRTTTSSCFMFPVIACRSSASVGSSTRSEQFSSADSNGSCPPLVTQACFWYDVSKPVSDLLKYGATYP